MVINLRRSLLAIALFASVSAPVIAAKVSDIKNTKHNLSTTPYTVGADTRTVKATSESQICVFCHTPHKANAAAPSPLWNRELSGAVYTELYTSESMDAITAAPEGSSKLCLSCHDGTMAIGEVGVLGGQENVSIEMLSTDIDGSGATTGFTRNLGTNLTNDHPISFTYDSSLAGSDGELLDPVTSAHIGTRVPGASRHPIPLEVGADGYPKVQCTSCHDPHIRDDTGANAKFLRLNRFQESASVSQGSFASTTDQICLGCHSKEGWSTSAHAMDTVANELYTDAAATQREFPTGIAVWKVACLNCHDTHTVQGAKRLLREGTDSASSPKAGGNPAQEQTCYQCHSAIADTQQVLDSTLSPSYEVPDIKSDFTTAGNKAMPIATPEVHAVSNSDLNESQALLNTRHAECTDCHNPHRLIKNTRFDGTGATTSGTHEHTGAAPHTNAASGVLKGMWGVEPNYPSTIFGPTGTPAQNGGYTVVDGVTKEYQVCLKCHSSYAYGTTPPLFDDATTDPSGTPVSLVVPSSNGFDVTNTATTTDRYTDQAMEFQAPALDKGEVTAIHRSWHPVIDSTGRTAANRANLEPTNFLAPWSGTNGASIGVQTMYCSDCHGSDTGIGSQTVVPPAGKAWGPHGSSNNFILKGAWDTADLPVNGSELCYKCHNKNNYSPATVATFPKSGFSTAVALGGGGGMGAGVCNMPAGSETNLHIGHKALLGELRCSWCHTAVPHGWRNKALLVDISNDPLAETGNNCNGAEPCNAAPYYQKAYLGGNGPGTNTVGGAGINWATSGNWVDTDCGGGGAAGGWMNNTCNAPQ